MLGVFSSALALAFGASVAHAAPAFGVVGQANQSEATIQSTFDEMQYRNLTRYRFDANLADDTNSYEVNMVRMMVRQAKAHNIQLKPILMVPFQWGDRTDNGKYPKGDAQALYLQGYNRTYAFVSAFKNDITDWELGNELNLLVKNASGSPLYGAGWTAAEFNTPLMNDWAQVLKGMSDAIDKVNAENGLHLRKTLNTTSTMLGFLDFMASKGVKYDVISYHYYENLGTDPNYYWGCYNLFYLLSRYNKPVQFNEVGAAEVYNSGYENKNWGTVTERGYKSLNNTLFYLTNQKYLNIEDIDFYEMFDEAQKSGAESRFGLLWSAKNPKLSLFVASLYSGGYLAAADKTMLANHGIPVAKALAK